MIDRHMEERAYAAELALARRELERLKLLDRIDQVEMKFADLTAKFNSRDDRQAGANGELQQQVLDLKATLNKRRTEGMGPLLGDLKDLIAALTGARMAGRFTVEEVARKAGVTVTRIDRFERGEDISLALIRKYAWAIEVAVSFSITEVAVLTEEPPDVDED